MAKIITFWVIGMLSLGILIGGGAWLFFWIATKLKQVKPFKK